MTFMIIPGKLSATSNLSRKTLPHSRVIRESNQELRPLEGKPSQGESGRDCVSCICAAASKSGKCGNGEFPGKANKLSVTLELTLELASVAAK